MLASAVARQRLARSFREDDTGVDVNMQMRNEKCIRSLKSENMQRPEISALMRYCAALSGSSVPTFRDKLSVPSSRVKKFKKTT